MSAVVDQVDKQHIKDDVGEGHQRDDAQHQRTLLTHLGQPPPHRPQQANRTSRLRIAVMGLQGFWHAPPHPQAQESHQPTQGEGEPPAPGIHGGIAERAGQQGHGEGSQAEPHQATGGSQAGQQALLARGGRFGGVGHRTGEFTTHRKPLHHA